MFDLGSYQKPLHSRRLLWGSTELAGCIFLHVSSSLLRLGGWSAWNKASWLPVRPWGSSRFIIAQIFGDVITPGFGGEIGFGDR